MRAFGALVCALVLASSGGAGAAQAEGIVPVEGGWKAETSAGLPVYFGVDDGRVINPRFHFHWGFCGTYGSHEEEADLEIDPSGHWIYQDPRGPLMEGTFVAANRLEGKVIAPSRELPGCPQSEATFVASPVGQNPESVAAARAGIEALPYKIRLREVPGVNNILIGKVFGSLGETFRFFLSVNRNAAAHLPGVPGYGFHGPHNQILDHGLEGGALANSDVLLQTIGKRGETKAQENERLEIALAVEETVCRRQTGKACPAV
jgi:hypothetical protein